MKPVDYLKALGVAVAAMALNLLLTTAIITVYGLLIAPGRPQSHYTAMAPQIGAWSGPAGGVALMFAAGWFFARRRPERNGFAFVAAVFAIYLAVDLALGLAYAPAETILTGRFAISLAAAGLAGLAGAALAPRRAAAEP
jgi:hypothetical protein